MEERGRKRMFDRKYGGKKGIQLRAYSPEWKGPYSRHKYAIINMKDMKNEMKNILSKKENDDSTKF